MRIVIVGASQFGTATAQELYEHGEEVVIVDTNREKLEAVSKDIDCGLIHGDGTLPSIQREAFADHADALVLLTNEDDVNVLGALVGRSVGFQRVVPQIVRPQLLAVCEELGLTDLITPYQTVASSIARALQDENDAAVDLRLHKGIRVLGYRILDSQAGKTVQDLNLPEQTRAIAVVRGESENLVTGETELQADDQIIIAVAAEVQEEVSNLFVENEPAQREDRASDP